MVGEDPAMDKWALIASILAIAALLAWILYVYNGVVRLIEPRLIAEYKVEYVMFIPVITDLGSIVSVSTGFTASMVPLFLYARRRVKLVELLEEQVVDFLAAFASIISSTRSTYEALVVASELVEKPLSNSLRVMAYTYKSTGNIQEAFDRATKGMPRRVRIFLKSIVTAARSGGNPHMVLSATTAHSREIRRLIKITRNRLSEYVFIVMLASITFAVSAGVMLGLLYYMLDLKLPGVGRLKVDIGIVRGLYFYSLIMINTASSIVIARIIRGYVLLAPKYFIILTLITLAAFAVSPLITGAPIIMK